jgi:HB1, ASXL, restriction endonuclease HTH domain
MSDQRQSNVTQARRGRHGGLTVLDAAEVVLRTQGRPMNYREITDLIVRERLWLTMGQTPNLTVHAALSVNSRSGHHARFKRVAPGVFTLRGGD